MTAGDLGDDRIGQFGRYWFDLGGAAGGVPMREAFDPAAIQHLLPNIIVVEHLGDGEFLYRLLGTQVDWFAKRNYTGFRTSQIPGHKPGNLIHAVYMTALRTRTLVGSTMPYVGSSAVCRSVRKIAAPFRTPQGKDQIVALIEFDLVQGVRASLLPPEKRQVL